MSGKILCFIYNNDVVKVLTGGEGVGQPRTLHDETGANYQVPAGKRFVALAGVFQPASASLTGLRLYDSTLVDSATGTIVYFSATTLNFNASSNFNFTAPLYFSIAATRYLNIDITSGFGVVSIIGVETDA